jgi:hypothetical protein
VTNKGQGATSAKFDSDWKLPYEGDATFPVNHVHAHIHSCDPTKATGEDDLEELEKEPLLKAGSVGIQIRHGSYLIIIMLKIQNSLADQPQ